MTLLALLRRPSVLGSVALHGAFGVVVLGFGGGPSPVSRPAELQALWCSDTTGSVDAMEVPPPPDVVPKPEQVPVSEPLEVLPPPVEDLALSDSGAEEAPVQNDRDPGLPPAGVRKTPSPAPAPAPAIAAPALVLAAAPATAASEPTPVAPPILRPPSSASRSGTRVNRDASALATNVPPVYPVEALRQAWEGTVLVEIRTDAMGEVVLATLARSSGYPALDDAALTAARAWRFSPRLVEGVPAPDWFQKPVVFTLRAETAMR